MKNKAIFVVLAVAALGFSGMAGAGNLPEGNLGTGTIPTASDDSPEAGFGLFAQDSFESAEADEKAGSATMHEGQVSDGSPPL